MNSAQIIASPLSLLTNILILLLDITNYLALSVTNLLNSVYILQHMLIKHEIYIAFLADLMHYFLLPSIMVFKYCSAVILDAE